MEMEDSSRSKSKVTRSGGGGGGDQRSIAASSGVLCEFLLSGFKEEREKKELMTKIRALGGQTKNELTYVSRCTHVVSYRPIRSEKFLCAIAGGKWVLKPEFITDSYMKGRWQEESKYEWGEGDNLLENILPGLLKAPRRWRKKVAATGQGAFHNWKVLLHVTNHKNREAVYRRVLEAGGGQCFTETFPIKDPVRIASLVTHVIVDKCYEENIKCLEARGVPCVLPEFIAEHLFQETPDIAKLQVSSTLMTPTQTKRQIDVVVSTVSTKKICVAHKTPRTDTFLKPTPRTRSRGKQTNLQEGERDTPGSTTSISEETTFSDPGRGVKRKLHFSPNQLREALQILKKRKLSSQHLPLVPYTMLIPRPKKTFQCDSDNCPSRPFPANICNSIEANIEENHWLDALSCIGSSISTHLYPPPYILYKIMQNMLQSTSLTVCCSAVFILKQILCLHSPACYPSLQKLYLDSMVPPPEVFKVTYHNARWHFVDAVIRRALDGQLVIQQDTEHKDEEDVKVAMETAEMLLRFLVSLLEEDYLSSVRRISEGTKRWTGLSYSIIAQILWPSSMEQSSSKVPINVQRLIHQFVLAVKMATECDDWKPVTSLLSTLMLMAADIHSLFGDQPGNMNTEKRKKEFAEKLASKAKQEGILATKSSQEMFFAMLKPSWLLMGVAECFLQNYDDRLLYGERAFWVEQPLTLRKIVSYYFYLVPPTAGPVTKEKSGEGKLTPLKTISNQQQVTCKNGLLIPKSSSKSSPKASPRKGNVNRKNPKGETQLHTACIKNKVETVRELLSEPDIDINAQDNAGWTPLHEACNHGHTDCVKELLEFAPGKRKVAGPQNKSLDLLAAPSECGTTPLHDAVNTNQIETVKLLVDAGGRSLLTMKNKAGLTPVDLASTKDMKEAMLCQKSEVSRLPAIDENSNKMSLLTVKNKDGKDAENAIQGQSNQQEVTFKRVLPMTKSSPKSSPRKNNVNRKNPRGETHLHTACIKNKVETVRELLSEPDIDINAQDNAGWTPLHEACNHGHTDCVKELLEFAPGKRKVAGPQNKSLDLLAAPSECGTTPLHDAVNTNQIETVKLLVDAGGRSLLAMKNKAGYTPLDLASTKDMKEAMLCQKSEVSRLPAIDENSNKMSLLTVKNKDGKDAENAIQGQSNQQEVTFKRVLPMTKSSPKSSPRKNNVNRKNPRGETHLHTACIKNKVETVRELLSEPDIDINAQDNAGWTPLHEACNHGHTDCVKELLEFAPGKRKVAGPQNKSLDLLAAPSECGTTPLHDAVNTNQIETVKLLVDAGGRSLLAMKNKAGYTPLDLASTKDMKEAMLCQKSEVSRLPAIDENSNKMSLLTVKNKDGKDAENAIQGQSNQQEVTFKRVLPMTKSSPKSSPRKNNVNRKNPRGETHLHTACIKNKVETVRELLSEPDIDINAQDNAGWTPLHEACNHGHTDCVKELLEFAPGKRKVAGPQNKSLDLLAAPSECGTTPLHDAVNTNQIETVKLLVDAGGRSLLAMKNKAGYTPLDLAFNNDMKEALLGQRSEVSRLPPIDENSNKMSLLTVKNKDGKDAENAIQGQSNQQEVTFKRVLPMTKSSPKSSPRKNNVNRKNPRGETHLHTACIKNKVETVRELLSEPDIDINAQDNAGWTPLHEACNHGHTDCVKELLEFAPGKRKVAGPQNKSLDLLAAPSECGTTPLHDAVNTNQIETVKLLVDAGGRSLLAMKNKAGYTPLDLAFNNDMKEALLGQRSEVSRLPPIDKENENKENLLQPHPSTYRQLLGPPSTNTSGYVTEEESEAFADIVMAMLQSYVRSNNLHRVKAEVDIIKGQKKVVNALRLNGGNASVSETTPFVSVIGSPSISTAGFPHTPSPHDSIYTENGSSIEPLLEDMEIFMELSRHTEGFKAHLRQISPTQEPATSSKSMVTLKVSRSMRLITHLCAVVS